MDGDDKTKDLEKRLAGMPAVPRGFVEGYGEGTAGWKTEPAKGGPLSHPQMTAKEGYDFNLSAATNRVCMKCGAVVADTDLHDEFHDSLVTKDA